MWNDKPPKIKNIVTVKKFEKGGLKIPHVNSFIKSNRCTKVKRLLPPENYHPADKNSTQILPMSKASL